MHTHDADEIMYVMSGHGKNICGDNESKVKKGSMIFAPEQVEHDVINESEEVLRLFCVYLPSIEPTGYFKKATEEMKNKFEEM